MKSPDEEQPLQPLPEASLPETHQPGTQEPETPAAQGPLQAEQEQKPAALSADPAAEPDAVQLGRARPVDPLDADDVMTRQLPDTAPADAAVLADSRRHTRRAFLVAGAGAAAAYGFYHWLEHGPQDQLLATPLRRAFDANAALSREVLREHALAPTYPLSRAETLRVNGIFGLKKTLEPASYRLQVVGAKGAAAHPRFSRDVTAWEYRYAAEKTTEDQGHDTKVDPKLASSAKMAPAGMQGKTEGDENHTGRKPRGLEEAGESFSTVPPNTPGLLLTLDDLTALPRHELVTQFKCIEGWSQVVHWAGVRMADFLEAYPPAPINGREPRFIYMETPDGDYYNGYDMHVCRHPQTLLVTEMMGAPLTQLHGAPLRLHMPTKYGYKQIKRIGLIAYTNVKPDDYWTELGYDWYAGL